MFWKMMKETEEKINEMNMLEEKIEKIHEKK